MSAGKWKALLEYGPIAAFFVAYLLLRDETYPVAGREYSGFIVVTALFIPLFTACMLALRRITGHLSKMQVLTLVLVVVFGGMTVWLNDERFFKMKPTLVYLIFAGILAVGLIRNESYLRVVMEEAVPLMAEGWMKLTRRLTGFFLVLAVLNEVVWRTMSTDAWVNFKTFGLTLAVFAFFVTQGRLFQEYGIKDEAGG